MPDKPVIFISHSSQDGELANAMEEQINRVFANSIQVFNSSGGSISLGKDWLNEIENSLSKLTAFVILVTPESIKSRWVWFETGAYWLRSRTDGGLLPLVVGMERQDVPDPINRLQFTILSNEISLRNFIQVLCDRFQSGNLSLLESSKIIDALNSMKQPNRNIVTKTSSDEISPYVDFSDEELQILLLNSLRKQQRRELLYKDSHEGLFKGEPVAYRYIDELFMLPNGTARKFLKPLMVTHFKCIPEYETENLVRFRELSDKEKAQINLEIMGQRQKAVGNKSLSESIQEISNQKDAENDSSSQSSENN